MTMRLIKPWAHQVFMEHQFSPSYIACTGDLCAVCRKVGAAQNLKALDDLVREKFRQA